MTKPSKPNLGLLWVIEYSNTLFYEDRSGWSSLWEETATAVWWIPGCYTWLWLFQVTAALVAKRGRKRSNVGNRNQNPRGYTHANPVKEQGLVRSLWGAWGLNVTLQVMKQGPFSNSYRLVGCAWNPLLRAEPTWPTQRETHPAGRGWEGAAKTNK